MNKEFELHYQPIVAFSNGEATKAEALIRWQHAERGAVSPAEFIPVAEDTGLIVEIGNWFEQAARKVAWRHELGLKSKSASINPQSNFAMKAHCSMITEVIAKILILQARACALKLPKACYWTPVWA